MPYPQSIHIPHTVVYDGSMPQAVADYYAITPLGSSFSCSFVYILSDINGDALYVGMSRRPGNRFDRHRRRAWWSDVHSLRVLKVEPDMPSRARLDAKRLETQLIRALDPRCNIAERVGWHG